MKAIGYMRLSAKDQSKSLEYQETSIRDYCNRNNLELTGLFRDNGESSYTFDRPDYKALELFLRKHKGDCHYLIVLDHDRFSRNLPEALMKIAELEKNYGVKVLSTTERVDLDTSDPDVFMKRALDYLMANKELFNIRHRTKQGIRNAKEKGRYLGRAPYGYKNIKHPTQKNLIGIDKQQAVVVAKIFHDYLAGVPQYIIYKSVKALGFKYTGKSVIQAVLTNCTYAGLIRVPESKDQPEKYVKAIHEPIVTEAEFWLVQSLLHEGKRKTRTMPDEDCPLRGVLRCTCGNRMTAGWSKGRNQYYLYYRCTKHHNLNVRGELIHEKFDELLREISLRPQHIEYLQAAVKQMLEEPLKQRRKELRQYQEELATVKQKILELEEKFLDGDIEKSTYQTWFKKLSTQKAMLEKATSLVKRTSVQKSSQEMVSEIVPELCRLYDIYDKCNVLQKQTIARGVFKDNLLWGGGTFRTAYINPAVRDNLLIMNKKGLLIFEQPSSFRGQNPFSTQSRGRTGTSEDIGV